MFLGALAPLAGRVPSQIVSVHSELRPAVLSTLHVLLYQFGSDTNDVLALPVLDHVQGLEGADDVLVSDAGQVAAGQERGCGVRQYSMCCFPIARSTGTSHAHARLNICTLPKAQNT